MCFPRTANRWLSRRKSLLGNTRTIIDACIHFTRIKTVSMVAANSSEFEARVLAKFAGKIPRRG